MQFYLYSCQDLIIQCDDFISVKAGGFYRLELTHQPFNIYSTTNAGVMLLNKDILHQNKHSQILFHKLSDNATLCEIKPFVLKEQIRQYVIKGGNLKVVENIDTIHIYFNGYYYGNINQKCSNIKFEKIEKESCEYGILYFLGDKKYIVLFNGQQILFCGQYIDYEILKDNIQIYTHIPNIFNVGSLISYNFTNSKLQTKIVGDRGDEHKQNNQEFNIIYFLEAIKCGRYKYAYNKLSYELKAEINIEVLSQYFKPFDKYIYLHEQNAYITLKNNKIIGVYHFDIKDNLIQNIF